MTCNGDGEVGDDLRAVCFVRAIADVVGSVLCDEEYWY